MYQPLRQQSRPCQDYSATAAERFDDLMKAPDLKNAIFEEISRRKSEKQVDEVLCLIGATARRVEQPLTMPVKQL
jgi:hypothetical protein